MLVILGNSRGGRTFYDAQGCRIVWEWDYGLESEAKKKLGFTIFGRIE